MAHDQKCYELAVYFLRDRTYTLTDIENFADAIQYAVEGWLESEMPESERAG